MSEKFKKAKINGVEIPVVVDNRALIEYKRMKGTSVCADLEEILLLTWFGIRSGARRAGINFKMTFEEFIDYTSDHTDCLPLDEPQADDDKKKANTM